MTTWQRVMRENLTDTGPSERRLADQHEAIRRAFTLMATGGHTATRLAIGWSRANDVQLTRNWRESDRAEVLNWWDRDIAIDFTGETPRFVKVDR